MARSLFLVLALLIAGCAPAVVTGSFAGLGVGGSEIAPISADYQPVSMTFAEPSGSQDGSLELDALGLGGEEPAGALLAQLELEPVLAWTEPAGPEPLIAGKALAEPTPVPYASFQMPVPFRSQKDGSRYQGSNCGPAALAMVFQAYGMTYDNDELRFLTHTYQGTVGRRGGTALQHMATVAQDFGLETVGLYEGNSFHRWTVAEIRAQLQAGRLVIPLVKYRLLPGHESSTIRFDHYIVIHGLDGDRFLYHDPAYEFAEEGALRWITASQLDAAVAPTLEPRQAVAIGPGGLAELTAIPI